MNHIDHLMCVVSDLAIAADTFRRLGFIVTDRSVHSGRGTANRLVVLPRCYLELLAVEEATSSNEPLRLAKAKGLFACALSSADIERDRVIRAENGIATERAVEFVRPLVVDGEQRTAGFRIARMRLDRLFNGYFFFCQHLTPDLVWRDSWMAHPNGALDIVGVDVVASDVAATVSLLSAIFRERSSPDAGGETFRLGSIQLRVLSREAFLEYYPGSPSRSVKIGEFAALRILVRDVHATASLIEANAIATSPTRHGFSVEPEASRLTLIEFLQE